MIEELIDDEFDFEIDEPIWEEDESQFGEMNRDGFVPLEYMQKVVDYMDKNPYHRFSSIHNAFKLVTWDGQQNRFRKYVQNYGTKREKLIKVTNYCYEKFKNARDLKLIVHGTDIKRWALFEARNVHLDDFTASDWWINKFKRNFRISSRKICKFVSVKSFTDRETIENQSIELLIKFQEEYKSQFTTDQIFNSDQSGFRYCHLGNRTLSYTGEKTTEVIVNSMNPLTHSYTIQPVITMSGKLLWPLFIVLKETKGTFGVKVAENLPHFSNLKVSCSKSGKLDRKLLREWVVECLDEMVEEGDKCLLFMDKWTGQSDPELFKLDNKEVILEYFPAGSTSFMQPEDISLFRTWKDFVKRFTYHCQLVQSDIVIHLRNNCLKIHSLIHNQLTSTSFVPLILYGWHKAGFPVEKIRFESLKEICFNFYSSKCSINNCCKLPFIQCAHPNCAKILCVDHFFKDFHFHENDDLLMH